MTNEKNKNYDYELLKTSLALMDYRLIKMIEKRYEIVDVLMEYRLKKIMGVLISSQTN